MPRPEPMAGKPISPKSPSHPMKAKRRIARCAVCMRENSIFRHPSAPGGGETIWPPVKVPGPTTALQATSPNRASAVTAEPSDRETHILNDREIRSLAGRVFRPPCARGIIRRLDR